MMKVCLRPIFVLLQMATTTKTRNQIIENGQHARQRLDGGVELTEGHPKNTHLPQKMDTKQPKAMTFQGPEKEKQMRAR